MSVANVPVSLHGDRRIRWQSEEDWRKSLNKALIPVLRSAPAAAGVSAMPKASAADAELLRLGVQFEPIEREYYSQLAVEKSGHDNGELG